MLINQKVVIYSFVGEERFRLWSVVALLRSKTHKYGQKDADLPAIVLKWHHLKGSRVIFCPGFRRQTVDLSANVSVFGLKQQ